MNAIIKEEMRIFNKYTDIEEFIKENYEPVEDKPGYVWLSKRNLQIIKIETLTESLKAYLIESEGIEIEIKALGQEPKTEWIPVSERLPKAEYGESDSVLVCFENETQDVLYFDGSNWRYPTGETYISVNHKNDLHNKVVAWMSLPEPYEPQERTDKK